MTKHYCLKRVEVTNKEEIKKIELKRKKNKVYLSWFFLYFYSFGISFLATIGLIYIFAIISHKNVESVLAAILVGVSEIGRAHV